MDKKDMFAFFLDIKNKYPVGDTELSQLFENYENKLFFGYFLRKNKR